MQSVLSSLSQGYGLCQQGGVILIPEASGSVPTYSQKIKGGDGSQLYGHFVPVPKTYLTRRGDIILFTENACDIVYLEQMYSKKIRELYEQQIKTVDDLNKSILFYGSKTPGEYSLNFVRGRFYTDRDIAVQPGHLPTHYLNTLTRHIKLSSVLRPRAPPSTGPAPTPWSSCRDTTVARIQFAGPNLMMSDNDGEEYADAVAVKYRDPPKPPTPLDMNKLPPIQVSQKYDAVRNKPNKSVSPRLNKVALNADVMGLHGTKALPPGKEKSEIPVLPKVVTGPSAKGSSRGDWKKLGSLIRSMHAFKEQGEKDKDIIKLVEDYKPEKSTYRNMMAMDLHFLKEDRRSISGDEYEDKDAISLDDVLLGLKKRHGKKAQLPPLQVDWGLEGGEGEPDTSRPPTTYSKRSVTIATPLSTVRNSPYPLTRKTSGMSSRSLKTPTSRKTSPTKTPLGGTILSPFAEKQKPTVEHSRQAGATPKSHAPVHPATQPATHPATQPATHTPSTEPANGVSPQKSLYQQTWSPDDTHADPELSALIDEADPNIDIDGQYLDHVQQIRAMLDQQRAQSIQSHTSVPAVYVDEDEQVYVGEIYGDMEPEQHNQTAPFDYMELVRNNRNRQQAAGEGELTLQSQSLLGGAPSAALPPGLYVARHPPSQQPGQEHPQHPQPMSGGMLGVGSVDAGGGRSLGAEGAARNRQGTRHRARSPSHSRVVTPSKLNMDAMGLNPPPPSRSRAASPAKKEGYVFRAPAPLSQTAGPDLNFPQRRLHQDKKGKSEYVFREQGQSSYLEAAQKAPRRGPSHAPKPKKKSGYVLRKGPQAVDLRGISRSAKRRMLPVYVNADANDTGDASPKKVFFMPELDGTTKLIIEALDTGANIENFDNDHLETARQIREVFHKQDSGYILQPADGHSLAEQDPNSLLKARDYLAQLREMRDIIDNADEDDEIFGQGALEHSGDETDIGSHSQDGDEYDDPEHPQIEANEMQSSNMPIYGSQEISRERIVETSQEFAQIPSIEFLGGLPDSSRDGTLLNIADRPGSRTTPHSRVYSPVPGQSWKRPELRTQTFGSEEGPMLPTMGDERYVINPSINYPSTTPRQEQINFADIRKPNQAAGAKTLMRGLPARKPPAHLRGFMSHAPSPKSRAHTPRIRPRSAEHVREHLEGAGEEAGQRLDLSAALEELKNFQIPTIVIDSSRSPSVDSAVMLEDEYEQRLNDTAENLDKIVKLRSELADNFHPPNSELDMFSDITDSEVTTPFKDDTHSVSVPSLIRIPEENDQKETRRSRGQVLDGSHAGVYLTELERDGVWSNEDIPVYVTPDGKVFISSVIINQPVCDSDRIKFTGQDDADDVHNKPEEGSLTFCGGELAGWVKFTGQEAVKIRGKRWDPRQTGHYVVEQKVTAGSKQKTAGDCWKILPLNMSIMLGGNVTVNEDPVHNPLFDENGMKLRLSDTQLEHPNTTLLAAFTQNCNEFNGKLTKNVDAELDNFLHTKLEKAFCEVEIRGKKWNPHIQGHYYCQKQMGGEWHNIDMPLQITEHGAVVAAGQDLGIPSYNGNEMDAGGIESDLLPDRISVTFLEGKFVGSVYTDTAGTEDIRGVRWNPDMVGRYSTQELVDDMWINKGKTLSIEKSGGITYNGVNLHDGFIVDNKIFVVHDGGLDDFFNNTGPVSDTNLAGKSFLMQRDSPQHHTAPHKVVKERVQSGRAETDDSALDPTQDIENAEIVFSSNRCYGHVTDGASDAAHREIRGYKWDDGIVGEYYTEIAKENDETWRSGPKITITDNGVVAVDDTNITDTLLKDNIVSINEFETTTTGAIKHCLVAIQDKLLNGWIQNETDSPKIQVRGSVWKEGPSTHGTYLAVEKQGEEWVSSSKSVIVTPSNKVRISDMNIEGDIDGVMAVLQATAASTTSTLDDTSAELRFEGDTFSGYVKQQDTKTQITGFKFDVIPGVYLLESRALNSDSDWSGLNLQLVVSDNGRISLGGAAVKNIKMEHSVLMFDSDSVLQNLSIKFAERSVTGSGELVKDSHKSEVEVRGRTWYPKIAGKYETELFSSDSGWKPAKHLEITPQGQVIYGSAVADGVRLDSDTMSFSASGPLKDGTLAFDKDGFSGNVVTARDNKTRVMRGKRIGTRPVSAVSGTELTLGDAEEEESFVDLNGQIGSKLKNESPVPANQDVPVGMTSDYGSASDMPLQLSGSRTEALSSLEEDISYRSPEEDISYRSQSPAALKHKPDPAAAAPTFSSPPHDTDSTTATTARTNNNNINNQSVGKRNSSPALEVDDIKVGLEAESDGKGVSFESWPPEDEDKQAGLLDQGVKLDVLPQGLGMLSGVDKKSDFVPEMISNDETSGMKKVWQGAFDGVQKIPEIESARAKDNKAGSVVEAAESPESAGAAPNAAIAPIPEKVTRTPLPEIPQKTLQKPALTKPVKLPGIDMKEKGKAAEVTEDSGILKNYIDQEKPKKTTKKKKPKKGRGKAKGDKGPDDASQVDSSPAKAGSTGSAESDPTPSKLKRSMSRDERAERGIEAAKNRSATPTTKTPIPLSTIDRDESRDGTPVSSGYNTPVSFGGSPGMPQREFQGALMAAKKIRETIDHDLDGKIPSDIREHPVAEEVAEKFGMEMKVKDEAEQKMSVKERRELARARKREEADRKRRERDDEKRRIKEEEEKRIADEEMMKQKRAEREAELTAARDRELQRRRDEETKRRQAKLDERDRKKREEEKMLDAKKKLEEELKRRREAETARLAEIERQKELALEKEREEREKRFAEAEAIRAQMAVEMERELAEYERKVREEEERKKIEEALKAEAERRLLDEAERRRIIALARHLWNKGVRIEGQHIQKELEISSIFYSYFNYLHSDEPFNPEVDYSLAEKILRIGKSLDKV